MNPLHDCVHAPIGHWVADWHRECPDFGDANAIMRTFRPRLQINLQSMWGQQGINEATYKDIVAKIDPNFLLQGQRADAPPTGLDHSVYGWRGLRGLRFTKFDQDTAIFYVSSSEEELSPLEYMNLIKFMDWDDICGDPDQSPRDKATFLLQSSNIQVHCDDPSFLYWGYQYILTQLDASVYPENRPPLQRNPQKKGIVCKHLNRLFRSLPFYLGDFAKAISEQWGGKITKREIDAIRRRLDLTKQANAIPPDQVTPTPMPLDAGPDEVPGPGGAGPAAPQSPAPQQPPQQPETGEQPPQPRPPTRRPGPNETP
jgi:hypothetical protein